jgi:adenine-specific DNA-methyltransferase
MFNEGWYPANYCFETETRETSPPLWLDRIIHGDCLDVMGQMDAASVDLIVTDPPYLVRYKGRDGRIVPNDDNDRWLRPAFASMARVLKDNSFCISFYGWNRVDLFMDAWKRAGLTPVGHFTFNKPYASSTLFNQSCHENAYLLAKGRPAKPEKPLRDALGWKYTGNKLHPTQKPVEILEKLVSTFSQQGGVVLDPFAGSASTAIAARNLGRRYIAIEQDGEYYRIARERLTQK